MKLPIVVLLLLIAKTSFGAAPAAPRGFSEEAAKQAEIYKSAGEKVPSGYVIDRSLLSYAYTLSPEFRLTLADLGAHDRWLDIGAGEGRAVLDYCTSKYDAMLKDGKGVGKARVVAMSIEDRRTARWHEIAAVLGEQQIHYVFGRRLREYSQAELGEFQLITDVVGGFSYTRTLSTFMEKTLGFLALQGSFHTLLQDVQGENGTNRPYYAGAPFLTEIVNSDGSPLTVCSWLKSISCLAVTCELKRDRLPPIEAYRVRKVCQNVTVPPLVLVHFEAGTPPERRFQLKSPLVDMREPADKKQ